MSPANNNSTLSDVENLTREVTTAIQLFNLTLQ